jgi:hypothetical protein
LVFDHDLESTEKPMTEHRSFRLTKPSDEDLPSTLLPQLSFMRSAKLLLGAFMLIGAVVSLIIYVLTFVDIVPPKAAMVLYSLPIAAFIPVIVSWTRLARSDMHRWTMAEARRAYNDLLWPTLRVVPDWAKVLCVLGFLLNFINGFLCIGLAARFPQNESIQFRLFSGCGIIFYIIPGVYFLCVEPRARRIREDAIAASWHNGSSPTESDGYDKSSDSG